MKPHIWILSSVSSPNVFCYSRTSSAVEANQDLFGPPEVIRASDLISFRRVRIQNSLPIKTTIFRVNL